MIAVLVDVLSLQNRAASLNSNTELLGALPEFDSMAVVSVITTLEERFDFVVEDDEVSGETFASIGALVAFVDSKIQ